MAIKAASLLIDIRAGIANLQTDMERAKKTVESAVNQIQGALAVIGVGFSASAFVDKIESTVASMAKLKDASEKTGASVEALSKLQFFAGLGGSSLDSVTGALAKLSKGMVAAGDDTGAFSQAMSFLGLSAKDGSGNLKDSSVLYEEIAKKLSGYADGAGKTAIAMALMGKAGADQLPIMNKWIELGHAEASVTAQQAQAAEDYEVQVAKLNRQKEILWNTITSALLPSMRSVVEVMHAAATGVDSLGNKTSKLHEDRSIEHWADASAMGIARVIDVAKTLIGIMSEIEAPFERYFKASQYGFAALSIKLGPGSEEEKDTALTLLRDEAAQQQKILQARMASGSFWTAGVNTSTSDALAASIAKRKSDRPPGYGEWSGPVDQYGQPVSEKQLNFGLGDGGKAASDNASAYRSLLKTLKEKLLVDYEQTEVNKLQLSLDALSKNQLEQITPERRKELETLAAQVDLNKRNLDQMKNTAENEEALQKMREEGAVAQAAVEQKRGEALIGAYKNIDAMEFETALIGKTNVERETATALRALENSEIDKQSDSYEKLREKMSSAIAAKNIAEEGKRQQVEMWQSIDRTAHDTFVSIFNSGKSAFDRLRDTLKNGLYDLLYQMTVKKWMIQIVGSTAGAGVAESAFGSAGSGLSMASGLNTLSGWLGGPTISAGSLSGAGAAASFAGYSGEMAAMTAGEMTLGGAGASAGMWGGVQSAMAAIPGWGWAALGAAAIGAYLLNSEDGDAQRSGNWSAKLGQVGRSPDNRWFDSSTGSGAATVMMANTEQGIISTLKLNTAQIDAINADLSALSAKQYGFGMEHTDWTQSGAVEAITADRLKVIAEALGTSIEGLAQQMTDAQKAITLGPQKRQMEIALMQAQGDAVGALAAKREDELKALDPTLRALQQQIYAAEDLAAAAKSAADATNGMTQFVGGLLGTVTTALDAMAQAANTASNAAHALGDTYRSLAQTLWSQAIKLSQSLGVSARENIGAVYSAALGGNTKALADLPDVVTQFLAESKASARSRFDYASAQAQAMTMLTSAARVSDAAASAQDHIALQADATVAILGDIKLLLQNPLADSQTIKDQKALLGNIDTSTDDQLTQYITDSVAQQAALDGASTSTARMVVLLDAYLKLQGVAVPAQDQTAQAAYDTAFAAAVQQLRAATGTITTAYEAYNEDTDAWETRYRQSFDLASFDAAVAAWKVLNPVPGHAFGGVASGWSMVGEQGPELVDFRSPGRVYTAGQTGAMMGAANDDLLAEMKALRAEVAGLRAEATKTSTNTRKTADTMIRVTRDGASMLTTAA